MRVVGGRLGGRRLRAVPGRETRPTSDRVKEALFGILGSRVERARVLDLFAGTGALAIEALSRGATSAVLVEQAAPAVAVIRSNLDALDLNDRVRVRRTRAETYLRSQRDGPFDLSSDPHYGAPTAWSPPARPAPRTALPPGGWWRRGPPAPRPRPGRPGWSPSHPAATATPPCTSRPGTRYPWGSRPDQETHPCGPLAAQAPTTR